MFPATVARGTASNPTVNLKHSGKLVRGRAGAVPVSRPSEPLFFLKELILEPGVVEHTFNPSTQYAEAGGAL